jgi:predicted nucleic acid-binding protein
MTRARSESPPPGLAAERGARALGLERGSDGRRLVVLDSNAVLDWLYFRDPRCSGLDEAVRAERVRWVASESMRAEIEDVIGRGRLGSKWPGGAASVRAGWQRWATTVAEPGPAPFGLRCSDADDQKFIDLAIGMRAIALLSADRAVLKLARRAGAWGVSITTVDRWTIGAAP